MIDSTSPLSIDNVPQASAGIRASFEKHTISVIPNDNPSATPAPRSTGNSEWDRLYTPAPVRTTDDVTSVQFWIEASYGNRKHASYNVEDAAVLDAIVKAELATDRMHYTLREAVQNECVSEETLDAIREAFPDFGVDELLAEAQEDRALWEAERIEDELAQSYCPQLPPEPQAVIEVDRETGAVTDSYFEDPDGNRVDELVTKAGFWKIHGYDLTFTPPRERLT